MFIEIKKFDFRGLKGQFDVKRANVRRPIAKIGHYGPFLLPEPIYDPFSMIMPYKLCPKVRLEYSRAQKVGF